MKLASDDRRHVIQQCEQSQANPCAGQQRNHRRIEASGWFAARPSGTENIYKLYAESLKSAEHLQQIVEEAQQIVSRSL